MLYCSFAPQTAALRLLAAMNTCVHTPSEQSPAELAPPSSVNPCKPRDISALLTLTALLVTLGIWFALARGKIAQPFGMDPHAWGSAHAVTIARSFIQRGLSSRAIPVQNNLPLGKSPDWYVHWPPLYDLLLAVWLRVFGVTEAAARASALLFSLAAAAALGLLANLLAGRRAAIVAATALLCLPIVFSYSLLVCSLNLAVAFMLLALWCFLRATQGHEIRARYKWGAIIFLLAGILCEWEPLLLCPALVAVALLQRNRVKLRLALLMSCSGIAAIIGTLAYYLALVPGTRADLLATIAYRAGFAYRPQSHIPLHALPDQAWYQTQAISWQAILQALSLRAGGLGLIGLFCVLACLVVALWPGLRRNGAAIAVLAIAALSLAAVSNLALAVAPLVEFVALPCLLLLLWPRLAENRPALGVVAVLAVPYVLWWVFMPNHALIHDYELMLFAPAAALAIALVFTSGAAALDAYLVRAWKGIAYLPLLAALVASLYSVRHAAPDPYLQPHEAAYGAAIRAATPAAAVVLIPSPSLVPVYYSERHIIRLVADDDAVDRVLPQVQRDFPGAPIYVAVPTVQLQSWGSGTPGLIAPLSAFRKTLDRCPMVAAPPQVKLARCR